MTSLAQIDPFLYGYFSDETLEHGERVGLALRCAAKHLEIGFSRQLLPEVTMETKNGTSGYLPSQGLWFNTENIMKLAGQVPEHEQTLCRYAQEIEQFKSKARRLYCESSEALDRAGAEWGGGWGGHSNPDYGRIVNHGTEYIRAILAENQDEHPDEAWFYRACSYALDAIDIFGERFRDLASGYAEKCGDEAEKAMLLRMAKAFETVPKKPAYDFTSAMCSFMLIFSMDGSDSPGRFDQYMLRAYAATENKEEAADLLDRLWDYFRDHRSWNLCISGSDKNGNDETNDLSYAMLALVRKKKYNTPNLTCRVHRNTPDRLWNEIADTLAVGAGLPALYNDDVVCAALEKIGIPPEDSHDYCMNGCNQIDILGKSHMGLEDGEVMFAKCLEFTLHNGVDAMTGEQVSAQTGDPRTFETYDRFERAFMDQLEYVTYNACGSANVYQHMRGVFEPHPLRSCLIEGCLEKGRDYRNGGPLYNHGQILAEGIADGCQTIMDSLMGLEEFNAGGVLKALLTPLADMAVQEGKILIASGMGIEAVKKALESLNGIAAMAAGAALIAIGTAAKSGLAALAQNGASSTTATTSGYSGGGSWQNDIKTEMTIYVTGKITGNDIELSGQRTVNDWSR